MEQKVRSAEDLKIVGIINPPEGNNKALALISGINFPYELVEKCIDYAGASQIVQDQLAKPDTDVLTGKTFAEQKKNLSFDTSAFMPAIKVDTSKFTDIDVVSIIKEAMTSDAITQIMMQATFLDLTDDKVRGKVIEAVGAFVDPSQTQSVDVYFSLEGEGYH